MFCSSVAHANCYMCSDGIDTRRSALLKKQLLDYFEKTADCKNITKCLDKDIGTDHNVDKKVYYL